MQFFFELGNFEDSYAFSKSFSMNDIIKVKNFLMLSTTGQERR